MAASGAEATTVVVNRCYPATPPCRALRPAPLPAPRWPALVVNLGQLGAVVAEEDTSWPGSPPRYRRRQCCGCRSCPATSRTLGHLAEVADYLA